MRITRIEAEGIFSFGVDADRFALDLGERLTVVVGPNASGKSNVSRLIDLVHTVTRFEHAANEGTRGRLAPILDDLASGARHDSMPANSRSTVRLGIRLTSAAEVRLVTSYVQVLVLAAMFGNQTLDEESLGGLEEWVAEQVNSQTIAALLKGTIVIWHSGVPGTHWKLGYEFTHDEMPMIWHLTTSTPNLTNVIAPAQSGGSAVAPGTMTLSQRFSGGESPPPRPIPPPTSPFSLKALLPDGQSVVRLDMPALNSTFAPAPHRAFVDALGMAVTGSDPLGPYRRSYSFAAVLSTLFDQGLRYLGPAGDLLAHATLSGSVMSEGESWTLEDRLHQLKNGDQKAQRRYQEIRSLFRDLAPGRRFELQTREMTGGDTVTDVVVFPEAVDPSSARARSIRFAGTGVEQALIIAEALADDPERVLVLDEPATNLHPAWQRIVRGQLTTRDGQCLLVTHSPFLVPADGRDELGSIVRVSLAEGATRVHRLSSADLSDDRWVQTMIKELAWSADARGLLFAAGVVLVEGQTELAALPTWFAKSPNAEHHRGPDDLHIAFYSVGGDQDFRPFVSFLERFGVPWAVIADGAAFRFDIGKHIFDQVLQGGVEDRELEKFVQRVRIGSKQQSAMTRELFDEMVEIGKGHGVFTLAPGWHRRKEPEGDQESFEAFIASQPELRDAAASAMAASPKSKPRAGRLLADATECPTLVNTLYEQLLDRLWSEGMPRLTGR